MGKDCPSRVPLLVALGEAAVSPAAQAITKAGVTPAGRECLVEALSRIEATARSAPALEALAAALVGGTAQEERLVAETLRRAQKERGPVPVAAVAALLPTADPANKRPPASQRRRRRARGARAGGTGPPRRSIGTASGRGGRRARDPAGGGSSVGPLAGHHSAHGQLPRSRRPVACRARPPAGDRPISFACSRRWPGAPQPTGASVIDTLRGALATGPTFEVRARAILALGQTAAAIANDEGTRSALASDLTVVRERSDDPVLRFLATRELGSIGGPAAAAALRAALTDRDPRVREAAAQGMGSTFGPISGAILGSKSAMRRPRPRRKR